MILTIFGVTCRLWSTGIEYSAS